MTRRLILTILAAAALLIPATAAQATPRDPVVDVTVRWSMPVPDGGWTAPPTAATATWPQTLATDADCGSWWQVDQWRGRQSVIDAILADGILSHDGQPEDHAVIVSWSFVQQPACAPVIPPRPDDVVTVADSLPVVECAAPLTSPATYTVTVTSTTSTTTHEWDGTAWQPTTTVTGEASSTRTITAGEADGLTLPDGCEAVVVPPVVEPPVTEPDAEPVAPVEPLDQGDDVMQVAAAAPAVPVLAETGTDGFTLAYIALALVALGSAGWYASQRRRGL